MKKIPSCLLSLTLLGGIAGTVLTSACSSTATRQSTGEYIDDTAITARVKGAFVKDETVKALDVNVETFRGVVQLSGFVDSAIERDRAAQIARSTAGVRDVTNNLKLKTEPSR